MNLRRFIVSVVFNIWEMFQFLTLDSTDIIVLQLRVRRTSVFWQLYKLYTQFYFTTAGPWLILVGCKHDCAHHCANILILFLDKTDIFEKTFCQIYHIFGYSENWTFRQYDFWNMWRQRCGSFWKYNLVVSRISVSFCSFFTIEIIEHMLFLKRRN